ncbi:MAG: hypothetical protein HQK52_23030 [Oligoflexia bacterium]|nr:hypothetical protein [Oligoflexia bacterium]
MKKAIIPIVLAMIFLSYFLIKNRYFNKNSYLLLSLKTTNDFQEMQQRDNNPEKSLSEKKAGINTMPSHNGNSLQNVSFLAIKKDSTGNNSFLLHNGNSISSNDEKIQHILEISMIKEQLINQQSNILNEIQTNQDSSNVDEFSEEANEYLLSKINAQEVLSEINNSMEKSFNHNEVMQLEKVFKDPSFEKISKINPDFTDETNNSSERAIEQKLTKERTELLTRLDEVLHDSEIKSVLIFDSIKSSFVKKYGTLDKKEEIELSKTIQISMKEERKNVYSRVYKEISDAELERYIKLNESDLVKRFRNTYVNVMKEKTNSASVGDVGGQ